MPPKVIVITGASSGFGQIATHLFAKNGHTVYAGVRDFETAAISRFNALAYSMGYNLYPISLDVTNGHAIEKAVAHVMTVEKRIDVLIHNAGHGSMGPAEAFTPEQLLHYYDINVVGAHRLNQAALPHMRRARSGLVVWTSSSSVKGGAPPFCGPYFAAKAAMDSLAVSCAGELTRWGIESAIIVPGAYPKGTNHFKDMGSPERKEIEAEYFDDADAPYRQVPQQIVDKLVGLFPHDAQADEVAEAMVRVVEMEHGKRPLRTHVDPSRDGCEVVNAVHDRIREELLRKIGLEDVLKPVMSNK